jgi:hypothetical protein
VKDRALRGFLNGSQPLLFSQDEIRLHIGQRQDEGEVVGQARFGNQVKMAGLIENTADETVLWIDLNLVKMI